MTVNTRWYTMDNKLGVNLNTVITSVTISANPAQPEYPGVPHNLGDRVQGNDGSEWCFVRASATVSAFNAIAIGREYTVESLTTTHISSAQFTYGVAQFQTVGGASVGAATGGVANAGDFFWALVKANAGGAKVNIVTDSSAAPGAGLWVSGTAGRLIATSVTNMRMNGWQAVATASGTAGEVAMFSYALPGLLVSAQPVSV